MRSFFWKTIPEEQVRGKTNIWTLAARQQHHYQIDTKTIEELFGQQEDTTKSPLSKRGGASNASFREAREEITILDAKRNMNIGIFLKQFKKSPPSIVEDIHQGKSEHYGSETLREFLKLLPESEEIKKLKAFSGDVAKLSLADSFLHCLIQVPKLSLDNTEAELHSLFVRTRSLKDNIQPDGELCQQMEEFLQGQALKGCEYQGEAFVLQAFALEKLTELQRWKQELQDEAHTLIDFFCEDKETMKLDECLQIFRDFCVKFNKAVKDNQERQVQELRQLQRRKELEQKRRSWAAGDLGFGRSSSENDVELLTKRGAEDLPPFLHPRPISPSYRPPNTRRSRLSLGISADRELLTFLENSTGSPEELKFNSLLGSCPWQAPSPAAWMEPGELRDQDSSQAHRPLASEAAFALPRVRHSVLRKRNRIKEHELVTGLAQFDLQAPKGPEETPRLTVNDLSPMELAPLSDPENKDPVPLLYISDTTDCSLTLDCSEGTDSRPEVPESPEEGPRSPPAPRVPRSPARVPSFARNTVASSSRCLRTGSPTVARAPGLTRTMSQRQLRVKKSDEGPAASTEARLKGRGAGERASLRLKDANRAALGKVLHPARK
ncbi:hypothetical protein CB1_001022002 [Camelus ferus]|nr:hypothetical protein CB1_001022002 [Camelus ferus]